MLLESFVGVMAMVAAMRHAAGHVFRDQQTILGVGGDAGSSDADHFPVGDIPFTAGRPWRDWRTPWAR